MKIISKEGNLVFDHESGTAKVIELKDKAITETLNISCVQRKAIKTEWEYIIMPYDDEKLQRAIGGLAYEIAERNRWQYPDCDNVKTAIMINMDSKDCDTFKATLYVEVQPPKYSEEEKADILDGADKNMYDTNFSEYTVWFDIFKSAEAYHKSTYGGMDEAVGIYDIEFEPEEQNALQWLLIQHLHMVACGGRYAS